MQARRLNPLCLALALSLLGGCGLEACGVGGFVPTPEPEAELRGVIGDLPADLERRAGSATLSLRALSVDGSELAEGTARLGEPFSLKLAPGEDHFNVRLVVSGGTLLLRHFAPEAAAGDVIELGTVGLTSTAASLVVERYAVRERGSLASTPTGTLAEVLDNASGDDPAVDAFRSLVSRVLEAADPGTGAPAFVADGYAADATALGQAGVTDAQYTSALEAAVDSSLVPVVCDPSRLRVMFAVDMSGQGRDGNGAAQFIRQPSKEGKVFLGITLDPLSPVLDSGGALKPRITPNDSATELYDDGTRGDEQAGDGIFTRLVDLPRGMRVLYKYTNGSAGEGFTGTEEWPGNARILQVQDVLSSVESGTPDCLVIRRDVFGDESSNKNFVNLNSRLAGGDLGYDDDLGGPIVPPPPGEDLLRPGGLSLLDVRSKGTLTPQGVPEARENGVCDVCPPPLTVSAGDDQPPRLVAAAFLATDRTRVTFSEDVDVQTAGRASNYLLVDSTNAPVRVTSVQINGPSAVLSHDPVDPRRRHRVNVKDVTDASAQQNPIAEGSSVVVGPDRTPPELVGVRPGSIVEVNPGTRPAKPETGEVVVLTFSEVLDRLSAESATSYAVAGLQVHAAYQRGREVYVVTSQQERGAPYELTVGAVFDVAGNVAPPTGEVAFFGLSLSKITFRAVVDFAWRSLDGAERGLPAGRGLYLAGTVMREARAPDGGDLRVFGRTDVTGVEGFRFEPSNETFEGKPVYTLDLRLPAGSYAFKLAHGRPGDDISPPSTLETVTKSLATRNEGTGVAVHPATGQGRDGISYLGARLSLTGQDLPGPGVLFKRENPDEVVIVGEADRVLPALIVSTWRDVPFGPGTDYDDGLVPLPMFVAGQEDTQGPRLLSTRARDSESVVASFDEAVEAIGVGVLARVTSEGDELPVVEVFVGEPLPNQVVVRTGSMELDRSYTLFLSGLRDLAGNDVGPGVTGGFTSPGAFSPFTPLVDDAPPTVQEVTATGPTEITVRFSERVAADSVVLEGFTLSHATGGAAPVLLSVRTGGGGRNAVLTTGEQERQEPYRLAISGVRDVTGNTMDPVTLAVAGFGEFDPPEILWARAVTPTRLAVKWNEPVTAGTAGATQNYLINGLAITAARFGASDELRNAAFNGAWAPLSTDLVILSVAAMTGGGNYTVTATGVRDLSGNESSSQASFTGVSSAPVVDVVLTYLVSDTAQVVGVGPGGAPGTPGRALSPADLDAQREGIFAIGTAITENGQQPVGDHPFTSALAGFPPEGSPLDGPEPELADDGSRGDAVAGDRVHTIVIPNVPLGSTLAWKAFASFTTAFGTANPSYPGAAFADAIPGPSVFADGQEYPGNDNAVYLVADLDGDGRIHIDNLFGDEITFKRKTGFPAFHLAVDRARRRE
jgi:hypothetical protein